MKRAGKRSTDSVEDFSTNARINTDPDGSWTGVSTEDKYEKPVQDVDDL